MQGTHTENSLQEPEEDPEKSPISEHNQLSPEEQASPQNPVTFVVFQNGDQKNVICGETLKSPQNELQFENSQNEKSQPQIQRRKKRIRKRRKMTFEDETSRRSNSHSRSRSVSYDARSTSRKGFFSQSFDSKLSEFSENEMVLLQKRRRIDEYLGEVQTEPPRGRVRGSFELPMGLKRVAGKSDPRPTDAETQHVSSLAKQGNKKTVKNGPSFGTHGLSLEIPEMPEHSEQEGQESMRVAGRGAIKNLLRGKLNPRKDSKLGGKNLVKRNITFAKEDEDDEPQGLVGKSEYSSPEPMTEGQNRGFGIWGNEQGYELGAEASHPESEDEEVALVLPGKGRANTGNTHSISHQNRGSKKITLDFGMGDDEDWDRRAPPAPRSRRAGGFDMSQFQLATDQEAQDSPPQMELPNFKGNKPQKIFGGKKATKKKFTADLVHIENDEEPSFPLAGSSWKSTGKGKKAPNAPRNNKKVSFNFGARFVGQSQGGFFGGQMGRSRKGLEVVISEGNSEAEAREDEEEYRESAGESHDEQSTEMDLELPHFGQEQLDERNRSQGEHPEPASKHQHRAPKGLALDDFDFDQDQPIQLELHAGNHQSEEETQLSDNQPSHLTDPTNKVFLVDDFEDSNEQAPRHRDLQNNLYSPRNGFGRDRSDRHTTHSSSNHSSRKQNQQIGKMKLKPKEKINSEGNRRGMLEIEIEEGEGATEMSSNSPRHCSQMEISEDSKPSQGSSNSQVMPSKRKIRIDEIGPQRGGRRNDHITFGQNHQIEIQSEQDHGESNEEHSPEPFFELPASRFFPKSRKNLKLKKQHHSGPKNFEENSDNQILLELPHVNDQTKNFEIKFDPKLLEVASRRDIQRPGEMSGCRTNPLPTCKNADRRKRGGFVFEGFRPQKKKRFQMSIAVNEDEQDLGQIKALRIEEESFEESHSSPKNNIMERPYVPKKRNLKLKINSKISNASPKNYSKQSSQVVNSIQMNSLENNFIISPKCGNSLSPGLKHIQHKEGLESIQMSDCSNSITAEALSKSISRHASHRGSGRSLKPMKLILKSQQNLGLILSDKRIDVDTSIGDKMTEQMELAQSESKPRRRKVEDRRWSKKTSMLSGNKSSLLSSGVGGSVSIGIRTTPGEDEFEEITILKKKLEKSEKRVNKIIKDNKRRNETYKRLWETQNQKIKELEETVQRVNSESNEMKKDMKIMVELRNYLQKKASFLEEENRRLRERSSNPNNLAAPKSKALQSINQRGWGEQSPRNQTKNLHMVESEMIGIMHSPIRVGFHRGEMKHYTSNNDSAMNSIDHKHGSPDKGNLVLKAQVLAEINGFEGKGKGKSRAEDDFRAGPHNTLIENSYEAVRRAREKVRLNELEIIIPEENEEGYGSSRELNLSGKSAGQVTGNGSKRKLRVQIKPKTFIIDTPWGGQSKGGLPRRNQPGLFHPDQLNILSQNTPGADHGWADFQDSKNRMNSPESRIEEYSQEDHLLKRCNNPSKQNQKAGATSKPAHTNGAGKTSQKQRNKTVAEKAPRRKKIKIVIPETQEEPVFKVQSTRVNKKIYFDHENGGLSFSKKLPGLAGASSRVKCHRAGKHSQSQFKKMKDMIFEKKRRANKRGLVEEGAERGLAALKRAKVPQKVAWRKVKMSSQTNLPGDPLRWKPHVAFTSHKRILQPNLGRPARESAQRQKKTNYSNRRGVAEKKVSKGQIKSHTPKISFTGLGPGGVRVKKLKKRRKTAIGNELFVKHSKARSIAEGGRSGQRFWGQEYYDVKPVRVNRDDMARGKIPQLAVGAKSSNKGASLRLFESGESLESDLSKRRLLMERVQTEPMSMEVEGEYFKQPDRNNCSISVNEVCFETSGHLDRLQQSNPTSKGKIGVFSTGLKSKSRQSKMMSTGKLAKETFGSSLKLAKAGRVRGKRTTQNSQQSQRDKTLHFNRLQATADLKGYVLNSSHKKSSVFTPKDLEPRGKQKQKVFRHNSRSPNVSKKRQRGKHGQNSQAHRDHDLGPKVHLKRKAAAAKRLTDLAWRDKSAREAGMDTDRTGKRVKELKRKLRLNQGGKAVKAQVRGMRLSVTSGKERGVHHRNKNHVFQHSLRSYQKQQSLRKELEPGKKHPRHAQEMELGFGGFRQAMAHAQLNRSKPAWAFQKSEIIGERSPQVRVVGAKKRKNRNKKKTKQSEEGSTTSAHTNSTQHGSREGGRRRRSQKSKNRRRKGTRSRSGT